MELKLKLGFEQILNLIKQLPFSQVEKLKNLLQEESIVKKKKKGKNDFQKFILSGPVMTDEQFQNFVEHRKHFSEWRKK
ncbi:MAG: hypothetical protein ABI855_08800 [Bacteroidota bacterium]